MHALCLLLTTLLTPLTSAIDITFYTNPDCTGVGSICTSQDPETCCLPHSHTYSSVLFASIAPTWSIHASAYTIDTCNIADNVHEPEYSEQDTFSQRETCVSGQTYRSAGWSFAPSTKHRRYTRRRKQTSKRADAWVDEGGNVFDIAEGEGDVVSLAELISNVSGNDTMGVGDGSTGDEEGHNSSGGNAGEVLGSGSGSGNDTLGDGGTGPGEGDSGSGQGQGIMDPERVGEGGDGSGQGQGLMDPLEGASGNDTVGDGGVGLGDGDVDSA
ncbi:hypothetical protein IQ06DRAFT_366934 [Phaeosphaeriaceae sp. SRC1lsM3a]|nr:hypothetical protein IQ06DRAFT_366934 [Stagonospora sp. SRC1lsM3a]